MASEFIGATGLAAAQRALRELGQTGLKKAVEGALKDVSLDATTRLKDRFGREIEGGPARFTKIVPGKRTSSVVERRVSSSGDLYEAGIEVQRLQSTYLKYVLGDETTREAGDVGPAEKHVILPSSTRIPVRGANLKVDAQGNLARNTLKRFTALSNKPRSGIFYGRLARRSGGPGPLGFWHRPAAGGPLTLLLQALERTQYPKEYLVPAWNSSVEEAMAGLPETLERRVDAAVTAAAAGVR